MNDTKASPSAPGASVSTALPVDLRAPLDELLDVAKARYAVGFETLRVGDLSLEVLQLADLDGYLEKLAAEAPPGAGASAVLPFWAKVWHTSILLAFAAPKLGLGGRRVLEIGAGVGVVGLAAAAAGASVLITDVHPDAALFSQINILKNGLEDNARAAVVDFTTHRLDERFDVILGSEVLYKEDTYRPLTKFLLAHLKDAPGAEVVLAREYNRKATKFAKLAEREFTVSSREMGFKGGDTRHLCTIDRMTPRKVAHGQA